MAEKSAIQRIKDLDAERASIFDQAKEEALEKAKAAVAELNGLGLDYTLTNGAGTAMTITGTNPTCVANSSAFTFAAVTGGNALTAGNVVLFNVTNTPAPSTDNYTICVQYVYTAQ